MESVPMWAVWVALAAAVTFLFLPPLLNWLLAKLSGDDEKQGVRQDKLRDSLGTFLGGTAVLLTFIWTVNKDKEDAARADRQQSDTRFVEAAKMLTTEADGHTSTARVAGAFALGNLARTDARYAMQVRDVLAAMILGQDMKGDAPVSALRNRDPDMIGGFVGPDINAALYVLGNRPLDPDPHAPALTLDGGYLVGGKMFSAHGYAGASFMGAALYGADFRCSDLRHTFFTGAHMADWRNVQGFSDEWLSPRPPAVISDWEQSRKYSFVANFEGADLMVADFRGADIVGADFFDADLNGAKFSNTNISRADFGHARNVELADFGSGQEAACADYVPRFTPPAVLAADGRSFSAFGHVFKACHSGQIKPYAFKPDWGVRSLSGDPARCLTRSSP